MVADLAVDEKTELPWLIQNTEKFCQDKAVYNAIRTSISILDDKTGKLSKGAIPKLLQDALAVTFDAHIGHDFLEDWQERYDLYHLVEDKIPFGLDYFNRITRGGLARKTLTIILAPTGVGKTLCMCSFAAANLLAGKNVLYITMEMAEERIAERIDANLLDTPIDKLAELNQELYKTKINSLQKQTRGRLIIKEYPTTQAGASHFRYLLNELKLKRNFIPDIVYVDYINICASTRSRSSANSYEIVKAIAEELRGLAVEFNVPLVTATQTNRTGLKNSDIDMDHTSDSFGLPMTADLFFALITTEDLEALNQILVKQLKNRYDDPGKLRRFIIGVDKAKMRLYDVENKAQDDLVQDEPVFDKGDHGAELLGDKSLFSGFR